jgi:outer membrane protein assembly factor BamB
LVALDAKTGKEKFHVQANGYVYSSPLILGNLVYFGDFTGQMFAVEINSNGKILDSYATDGRKRNAPAVLNGNKIDFAYMVKGMDLSLYSSTEAGINKLYSLGPIVSSPALSNRTLYFGSADSCIYALELKEKLKYPGAVNHQIAS